MNPNLFNKYIWLVDTIYSAGSITRDEIDRKWSHSALNEYHETQIPRTTFQRWRAGVEEVFGLIIDVNLTDYSYYIANRDELRGNATTQWLLHTFAVTNMVHEGKDIQDKILLESMPSDGMFLTPIMESIRLSHKIQMTYQKFLAAEPHTFGFSPLCLKTFKQRWYVAGISDEHPGEVRVYGLDRVQKVENTAETYVYPKDFDGAAFFHNYYGIWHDEETAVEEVIVRVSARDANYLRSLPLHHSQREIETTQDYAVFRYVIAPTFDFIQELRTHGAALKVLSPQWLAQRMRDDAQAILTAYEED